MQTSDHEMRLSGDVIPFQPRDGQPEKGKTKKTVTTTIAALIAVTLLHDDSESAEDKLIDMIEASGEAEVMDSADALDMMGDIDLEHDSPAEIRVPANDNS